MKKDEHKELEARKELYMTLRRWSPDDKPIKRGKWHHQERRYGICEEELDDIMAWHRKFSAPEVSREDIEKVFDDSCTDHYHIKTGECRKEIVDRILRLLTPKAALRWCEHIDWAMCGTKMRWCLPVNGGTTSEYHEWVCEWKFCPICGKERPA